MKVCPQYNRGKCSITEADITDGTLRCPKHKVPLVDLVEKSSGTAATDGSPEVPPTDEPGEPDTGRKDSGTDCGLVCSHRRSHDTTRSHEPGKCWCGADLIGEEQLSGQQEDTQCRLVVECCGQSFESDAGHVFVGRKDCFDEDLRILLLDKNGVSRKHLEIALSEDNTKVRLREAGKTKNGTFVGKIRISEEYREFKMPVSVSLGNPNSEGASIEVRNG